ncbi:MAG: beta-propeller domain-containing protein [Candidatus Gracilibacteria bacterium]
MKKTLLLLLLAIFSLANVSADDVEDTSIIDELEKQEIKVLDFDFKLKSFESCEGLEKVMGDYIKDYWENNKDKWAYPVLYRTLGGPEVDMIMDENISMEKSVSSDSISGMGGGDVPEFSKTNTQVEGVDESDIVKTDGKYIYYYNDLDKYVYIVSSKDLQIIKKIKLPSTFYSPVLYIGTNRLIIVSSGYSNINYGSYNYWVNRNAKTYTIVFDTTNIKSPILSKLYVADGDLRKSRKIGDYVYTISNNNFSIPYRTFEKRDDIKIDIKKLLPKKIDISKTSDESKQNLELRGKNLPYNITVGDIAKCSDIEYVLPDAETMKQFDFNPSYNIISIIDTRDTSKEVKTKVIAGSNSEIYMSLENLYLTSNIYQTYDFKCSSKFRCFAPWYPRGTNTLVHKINVDGNALSYQDSTIIPGSPLTQYSMDEYKGDFRILTQTNNWNTRENQSHTDLYILDKDLNLEGSLTNLGNGEQFKSSRYIGDKLFLVTFKQVDPLYAIDVADSSNPKILGELKIPGYSTYLHPYDESHLIGLGYDTTENQWGGTINNGLKIDLYEINYDKKCGDSNLTVAEQEKCDLGDYKGIIVKQKYSHTLGEYGSYSEALNNPRMFMWKASNNKLFLPATLYYNDKDDQYRHVDFFQGLVTMTIDKDSGINENFRLTHLDTSKSEEERNLECSKYTKESTEKKCVPLIGGGEFCEDVQYRYVPKYCYADSTIGEYIASKSWNYRDSFIKRALWIGNNTYSISNDLIKSSNIDTGINTGSVRLYK